MKTGLNWLNNKIFLVECIYLYAYLNEKKVLHRVLLVWITKELGQK